MSSVTDPSGNSDWHDRTILPVVMKWDYGDQARGRSCEDAFFVQNLRKLASRVEPVWIDDVLTRPDELMSRVEAAIERHAPDLLFLVPFRDEFTPEMLRRLRERVDTLAWFSDDEWRFEDFTRHLAPHYTYVCTTDPLAAPAYRSLGVEPILTAWAGQLTGDDLGPIDSEFEHDVSFVGGLDPNRRWFLRQLQKRGIAVEHFGAGSPHGRVSFDEMEHIFRTSRVSLNLSNSRNSDIRFVLSSPITLATYLRSRKTTEQIKARNFEIPLAGGLQVTNYVPGLERHFEIGTEVVAFATVDDCARQIQRFLDDPLARNSVARAGYDRARKHHTYEHRFRKILARIWD